MGVSHQLNNSTMKSVAVLLLVAIVSVSLANTGFDEEVPEQIPEESLMESSTTATSSSRFNLFARIKAAIAKHRRKVCGRKANKCHKKVAKKMAKHHKIAKHLMKKAH